MKLLRLLPRFRAAYRALPELAERETWPRERIEAYQLDRLNEVWGHAREHVPYYARLAGEHRLPGRFASLAEYRERMPVLTKRALIERREELLSRRAGPGHWHRTSGSTGTTTTVFWANQAYPLSLRARYRFFQSWGVDLLDCSAFLWGHATSFPPGLAGLVERLRQPLEDRLRSRLRLPAYTLRPELLRGYLRRLRAYRPRSLYAYSTAAYLLAQEAERSGLRCGSLKVVTTTGEPLYPHMRRAIERGLGAPAAVEYGSIECGLMASEGPDRKLRVREDLVHLEDRPGAEPGGPRDLVVTMLYNPAFPLLRYEIGDATDRPVDRPGRGFAALNSVIGRSLDLLRSRGGDPVHPFLLETLLEANARVRRWRVHQALDGSMRMALQPVDPADLPDLARLTAELGKIVGGYPVRVDVVDDIPAMASGKYRYVTSDMTGAADRHAGSASQP